MRTSSQNSRGFSLLEVLLATFIFSIIMVGVTSYFVSITVANQNTKRLQQNLEDIQFTMNRIAKSLRTSVVISSHGDLRVFDYSQSLCLRYKFEGNGMVEYSALLPEGEPDEKVWCNNLSLSSFTSSTLVSVTNGAALSGQFFVSPSSDTPGSEAAGRITMNATISRQGSSSTIQTTVSLRNYKETFP